jgi:diketogulonate reductase-like aldo/keto reductase
MSIGVSNFDVSLLNELASIAEVLPHVVQNWAEPGNLDLEVREWCFRYGVLYQPYASGRNINRLPPKMRNTLGKVADNHKVSPNVCVLRFFTQTGAVTIPSTSKAAHLLENIQSNKFSLTEEELA